MNQKEKRPNKTSKLFVVCNYGDDDSQAKDKCHADLKALEQFVKNEIDNGEQKILDAVMAWEERAPTTGTVHWHAVIILGREFRMRPL